VCMCECCACVCVCVCESCACNDLGMCESMSARRKINCIDDQGALQCQSKAARVCCLNWMQDRRAPIGF